MGKRYAHPNQMDLFSAVEVFINASEKLSEGISEASDQADGPAFDSSEVLYRKEKAV
jgi:hypothetical protein